MSEKSNPTHGEPLEPPSNRPKSTRLALVVRRRTKRWKKGGPSLRDGRDAHPHAGEARAQPIGSAFPPRIVRDARDGAGQPVRQSDMRIAPSPARRAH
jgi:hypothetical protein